jgi:hypothetical protein
MVVGLDSMVMLMGFMRSSNGCGGDAVLTFLTIGLV